MHYNTNARKIHTRFFSLNSYFLSKQKINLTQFGNGPAILSER